MKLAWAAPAVAMVVACVTATTEEPRDEPRSGLRAPELGPVPPLPTFEGDPITDAKKELGALLFFDERLSGTRTTSCASCHAATTAFQDNLVGSTPDRSKPGGAPQLTRNTTSFLNLLYAPISRWDGALGLPHQTMPHLPADDLLDVITFPWVEPNMNLGADFDAVDLALKERFNVEIPGYAPLFEAAFDTKIASLDGKSIRRLAGRALRAFLSVAVSRDAPFDRWNAGDDSAMSASAARGVEVFRGKGRCTNCHSGPLFTDYQFHNLSTSPPGPDGRRSDEGRYLLTRKEEDRGKFLTPSLRGVYDTGPYFHAGKLPDGSTTNLRSVFRFLASPAARLDPNSDLPVVDLSEDDIDDLVEFMKALRGAPTPPVPRPSKFP